MKTPSYLHLSSQDWDKRITTLDTLARSCRLCPRQCGIDRFSGEKGFCKAPDIPVISSIFPHHGEEPPLSGTGGSGTVFFSHCTLGCLFCQNFQISHEFEGRRYRIEELADAMVKLQDDGCHNINLVTATHFLPWIVRALKAAVAKGLSIPIVYNCGGYELASVMTLLKDMVDIFLPDMKYGNDEHAKKYSNAGDYVAVNQATVREMYRQVGPLRLDSEGIYYRGLCVRHLVLPHGLANSEKILEYLKRTFDPHDISISLMAQYRPLYKASAFPELCDPIEADDYETIKQAFQTADFGGYYQDLSDLDRAFIINFKERRNEPLTGAE